MKTDFDFAKNWPYGCDEAVPSFSRSTALSYAQQRELRNKVENPPLSIEKKKLKITKS